MSGGEPSSTKQSSRCAVRVPVLSSRLENRVGADFDLGVYGLVLRICAVYFVYSFFVKFIVFQSPVAIISEGVAVFLFYVKGV